MKKSDHPLVSEEIFLLIQWILDPKVIDGALRSAIHAHGPITARSGPLYVLEKDAQGFWMISEVKTCSTSSASKRIRGAIRTRIEEYLANQSKKELDKPKKRWYSFFAGLGRPTVKR